VLLLEAEVEDFVDHGGECGLGRERAMAAEGVEKARFAEFLAIMVEGFGDAVGVESEDVAGGDLAFAELALPLFENAKNRGGGVEARHAAVVAEEKGGEMATVGVAEQARRVVVFGEKKSSEGTVGSVFAEELIYGTQQMVGLLLGDGAETAEICLQVGH